MEEYEIFDKIKNNQEQYQVKEINKEHNEITRIKNTEIVIEEKNNPSNNQPSLFDENQKEQEARLFIEKYAGILTGAYDSTKSAKEMKRELLDKDLEEGRI